ncbi:glycosyltransferase family 4 protein [Anabaena sphaerica FACHB-251]|uniref:Glycosyltransferase family 4 protein n=1 Tax=Anabaena sphaerica FACHB-251 TaxID=2692883 RepID=A0A926WD19_9NOST|nr:glycosyltransferase family 4 protein [Anabaena sphaerica]MBD2292227.1 glycosyltransferase family 4 protein [Anabaena sphaerica FACHB-251]
MIIPKYKLLFISTPVGAIGTGVGGGVELTLFNITQEMKRRGHKIEIIAPNGSVMQPFTVTEIAGELQIPGQTQTRDSPITMPKNSVLANMWDYARQVQSNYDLIVNFAYDWLPLYLTSFFQIPIAHLISMGSLTDAMDSIIEEVAIKFPGTLGVHSQTQAATFTFAQQCTSLLNGMDLSIYHFCHQPNQTLAWVGRIAPEKGLEDAVASAKITGIPLKIFGLIQDESYWQKICQDYPDAPIEYMGFLPTVELQKQLGKCMALLVTPRWVEAFGNVAIEALACGVPLIAYRRGGLTEIVQEGKTGFLVEPDSVQGLVDAIGRLNEIDRYACRQQAEVEYSLEAMGDRVEQWFEDILTKRTKP